MKKDDVLRYIYCVLVIVLSFFMPKQIVYGISSFIPMSADVAGFVIKLLFVLFAYAISCWFCYKQAAQQKPIAGTLVCMALTWMVLFLLTGRINQHYELLSLLLLAIILGAAFKGDKWLLLRAISGACILLLAILAF